MRIEQSIVLGFEPRNRPRSSERREKEVSRMLSAIGLLNTRRGSLEMRLRESSIIIPVISSSVENTVSR